MPKVQDLKTYWSELARKNNLSDEDVRPILEAMDKDNIRKAFTDNFKPLPDYSHDLDEVRNKAKQEKDEEYAAWYQQEQEKYRQYQAAIDALGQYEARYGRLDAQQEQQFVQQQMQQSGGPVITKDDIERLLEERLKDTLSRRDTAYMDLLEIREQHMTTFKKPLNVKEFEDTWRQHPEWGNSMRAAYQLYTAPETEKIQKAEFDAQMEKRYQEGVRDGFSRRSLPADNGSKEFSPFFDQKEDVLKMGARDQERHSREAFFEGLRNGK